MGFSGPSRRGVGGMIDCLNCARGLLISSEWNPYNMPAAVVQIFFSAALRGLMCRHLSLIWRYAKAGSMVFSLVHRNRNNWQFPSEPWVYLFLFFLIQMIMLNETSVKLASFLYFKSYCVFRLANYFDWFTKKNKKRKWTVNWTTR